MYRNTRVSMIVFEESKFLLYVACLAWIIMVKMRKYLPTEIADRFRMDDLFTVHLSNALYKSAL